jgi:hypothetical protein
MAFNGNPTQDQRLPDEVLLYRQIMRHTSYDLRVAMPGIIQSFDSSKMTVVVQLAIRDKLKINNIYTDVEVPLIPDVPLMLPHGGGFSLNVPVVEGDECLLICADMCINGWWIKGGVQNQEVDRRHDFSDGFAVLGPWSQATKPTEFNQSAIELTTEDRSTYVSVTDTDVNILGEVTDINSLLSLHGTISTDTKLNTIGVVTAQLLAVKINGVDYYIRISPL